MSGVDLSQVKFGSKWKHNKGALVTVKAIAREEKTQELVVVYEVNKPASHSPNHLSYSVVDGTLSEEMIWVRPLSEFLSLVKDESGASVPRFTLFAP